jgi:hypothetical protein
MGRKETPDSTVKVLKCGGPNKFLISALEELLKQAKEGTLTRGVGIFYSSSLQDYVVLHRTDKIIATLGAIEVLKARVLKPHLAEGED